MRCASASVRYDGCRGRIFCDGFSGDPHRLGSVLHRQIKIRDLEQLRRCCSRPWLRSAPQARMRPCAGRDGKASPGSSRCDSLKRSAGIGCGASSTTRLKRPLRRPDFPRVIFLPRSMLSSSRSDSPRPDDFPTWEMRREISRGQRRDRRPAHAPKPCRTAPSR